MKTHYLLLAAAAFLTSSVSYAADEPVAVADNGAAAFEAPKTGTLKANFRRVGLELSSTDVSHATEYKNSPVSQLSADSQTVVKGVFDFVLEYNRTNMMWNNSLYMDYAKTKLKPAEGPSSSNEDADTILFSSDYAHKTWLLGNVFVGPMATLAYQTEFTENNDAPRSQIARAKAGMKVFEGKLIKDLYLAGVAEYDMTYSNDKVSKTAWEFGWRLEHVLREGVKLSTDGYYRDYLSYSNYVDTDLEYDLNAKARMDVNITKTLTMGPYISYRQAKSREAHVSGSNFMVGLAFGYTDLFNLR